MKYFNTDKFRYNFKFNLWFNFNSNDLDFAKNDYVFTVNKQGKIIGDLK